MVMAGTCDAMVTADILESAYETMPTAGFARFRGAGHLAFSDLCDLDMGTFAEEHLLPRDDINAFFLDSLVDSPQTGVQGRSRRNVRQRTAQTATWAWMYPSGAFDI